jgi:hypothetical protein
MNAPFFQCAPSHAVTQTAKSASRGLRSSTTSGRALSPWAQGAQDARSSPLKVRPQLGFQLAPLLRDRCEGLNDGTVCEIGSRGNVINAIEDCVGAGLGGGSPYENDVRQVAYGDFRRDAAGDTVAAATASV